MRTFLAVAMLLALSGCDQPTQSVVTLYRNSILDPSLRIHLATFDADNGSTSQQYNSENCFEAADLYSHNDPQHKRFWCELGQFKK